MKKIIRYFAVISLSALALSCSGFLDENPTTQLTEKKVYGTREALESDIYGCLQGLCGDCMITGNMNEFVNNCSGLIHWGYSSTRLTDGAERWIGALNFTQYSRNTYNYSEFTGFYACVGRCNNLLEQLPSSPVDEEYKTLIEGEARFIRALCYYYLVRQWGDVPLYLTTAKNLEDANRPRTDFWKIYEVVVDDFSKAAEMMDEYRKQNGEYDTEKIASRQASGRPTAWAAKAMLSQVYLTIGTLLAHPDDNFWDPSERTPDFSPCGINTAEDAFLLSLENAEDVIENGPYELEPDYRRLFRWTDPEDFTLKERIFVIPNVPEVNSRNYTAIRSLPKYPEGTANVSVDNSNSGRWRPTRFVFQHWASDFQELKPGTDIVNYKGTSDIYHKYTKPDKTSDYIFTGSPDPRFNVTIWHTAIKNQNTGAKELVYPSNSALFYEVKSNKNEPFFKKYLDPLYNADSGHADFYLMRFAEMYLIAAEAAAYLTSGPGDEYWSKAYDYVEVIHERARNSVDGTPAKQPTWYDGAHDFTSKEALISAIFWERVYEMYAEGHEYWDTHRCGATWLRDNIAVPANEFYTYDQQRWSNSNRTKSTNNYMEALYGNTDFQYVTDVQELRKSLLCAFPNDEIVYNRSISSADQNKYWWH